jgi:hypothetical protein
MAIFRSFTVNLPGASPPSRRGTNEHGLNFSGHSRLRIYQAAESGQAPKLGPRRLHSSVPVRVRDVPNSCCICDTNLARARIRLPKVSERCTTHSFFESDGLQVHLCHSQASGNPVKVGDGCATVTGYKLPKPLPRFMRPCSDGGKAGARFSGPKSGYRSGCARHGHLT